MANLDSLIRWQRYLPDLGDNRALRRPFHLLLAVGLTKPDLLRLAKTVEAPLLERDPDDAEPTAEELDAAVEKRIEALAAVLAPFVRMGDEPLNVNGEAIDSLAKLLKLYANMASGPAALLELPTALRWYNTAGGTTQLFFERLSGGSVSTGPQRAAR